MARITLSDARARVAAALQQAGANPAMAESTARALVLAESQGLGSHGIGRVAQYCTHLRNGRVHGDAVPTVAGGRAAAAVIDAQDGLAFPACELAVAEALRRADAEGLEVGDAVLRSLPAA